MLITVFKCYFPKRMIMCKVQTNYLTIAETRYYITTTVSYISHAHTVVWECCKDDRQSQWGMAKCDSQPTLNPLTDCYQIWNTWLRRGHLLPRKIRGQSAEGFLPPTYVKYTPKTFECLLLFFLSSSEGLETRSLDRFSRLIRHMTWFC